MPLSRISLLCLCALAIVSCSKNYKTEDRRAMSIIAIPLYDSSGQFIEPLSFLEAGTNFYVTDDKKLTTDDVSLVRVIWDKDSTAYVNEEEFLVGGRYAVVTGTDSQIGIPVYEDAELTQPYDDPLPERWTLVAAFQQSDKVTEILFDPGNSEVLKGYVTNDLVVTDQKEIDFYNMFMTFFWMSKGDSIVALPEYANYRLLPVAAMAAAEDMNDEAGDGYEDVVDFDNDLFNRVITETGWTRDGNPAGEPGGEVKKFFVFEDNSEAPAEGFTLENGYPWRIEGTQEGVVDKNVLKVRFEVTPARNGPLRFDVETYYANNSPFNDSFFEEIPDAEAGKPYSVSVRESDDNSMILCSAIRVTITTGGLQRAATISGSCGD